MFLTRWDPFETLTSLQQDVDRLFDRRLLPSRALRGVGAEADWLPAVDIHEDKEGYTFDIEAPGMIKESFDINIDGAVLTVKGERKREEETKDKNYFRIEREYGAFARSFTLPDTADTGKVNAEYKNGILHVKIAKKEAAKPKQIPVKVAA